MQLERWRRLSPNGHRRPEGPPQRGAAWRIAQSTRCPTRTLDRASIQECPHVDSRPGYAHDTELLTPATQVVSDKDVYLGNGASDVGRRVGDDQLELFVVCHPAEAMRQQFAQLTPDYIAIHDVGGASSARLIAAVAAAASRKLQKLVIRRQGYGVALATLQFVELSLQGDRPLRIYTTQIDGDTQSRHLLAQVLLAHSRLGVVMVSEMPAHVIESGLQPLRDAIASGPWPNRQLLLVPLANTPSLPQQAAAMAGASDVVVRTTPTVTRPAEAWSFISGAWNRLHAAEPRPFRPAPPADVPATPPRPSTLGFSPMPPVPGASTVLPQSRHQQAVWADYVRRCESIKGLAQACFFDIELQRPLAHSGPARTAERLAAKGAMLHAVMLDTATALDLGAAPPDAAITLAEHYLLMRPMPGRPGVALHLMLDRSHGNIGMARAQLHQSDQA